jgi:hypothetical protein
MEQEVNILKKLLNNKIFLSNFPLIRFVHVNQYGKENIDVVFTFNDGFEYSDYKGIREESRELIYQLAKYAGINPRFISIYPQ